MAPSSAPTRDHQSGPTVDDLLNECIRLAHEVGDGDASVAIKRRKRDYNVLAFFNLTINTNGRGTLGYIGSYQDPELLKALEGLRGVIQDFLKQRAESNAKRMGPKKLGQLPGQRSH